MCLLDKTVLIQYCDIKAETKEIQRLIKQTEHKLEKIWDEGVVSDVVRGGMGGIEHFKVTGLPKPEIARTEELLRKRNERLKLKELELLELTNRAEEFIEGIDKPELRIMFRLYYMEDLTWAQVAIKMNKIFPQKRISYTEDSCRMRNQRFFEKN